MPLPRLFGRLLFGLSSAGDSQFTIHDCRPCGTTASGPDSWYICTGSPTPALLRICCSARAEALFRLPSPLISVRFQGLLLPPTCGQHVFPLLMQVVGTRDVQLVIADSVSLSLCLSVSHWQTTSASVPPCSND
ncbi:hypothetical protein EXIGLDRAFT_48738 [Exidia glandulosa HHB12029]|uniref:Secreted protein n=1 Tax=Exidia glandulosa HHB12029 TaxID=1314781 RepID=A0A165IFF5_EXIGL|nr:hypothetical protein EXIGLDRAFT_48738 [Exidia glandulosa HHB12029]